MPIIGPDVRPAPPPFFTRSQVKVSETMARHVRQHKTDFLVNVGDNFYLCGVPNLENIRFEVPNFLKYLRPPIICDWFNELCVTSTCVTTCTFFKTIFMQCAHFSALQLYFYALNQQRTFYFIAFYLNNFAPFKN